MERVKSLSLLRNWNWSYIDPSEIVFVSMDLGCFMFLGSYEYGPSLACVKDLWKG